MNPTSGYYFTNLISIVFSFWYKLEHRILLKIVEVMTPPIDKPHCPSSSFWSSSLNLVLFLVIPLVVFLVLVSTSSSLSSLSSPWTWRFGNSVSHSFASYPSSLIEETPTNNSNIKGYISNGSSTDSSLLEAGTDYSASNMSFSDAFIEKETVQLVRISF